MKKVILLIALFAFTSFVMAQNVKVPEKAKSEFANVQVRFASDEFFFFCHRFCSYLLIKN